MAHVDSAEPAVRRLRYSEVTYDRTVRRAHGDPDKIRQAEIHRSGTVRNTRRQVRYRGSINPLERSILGLTGSPETLARFRVIAQDLGEKAGQPLVKVGFSDKTGVQRAVVGELTGQIDVRDGFSHGADVVRSKAKSRRQKAPVYLGTGPLQMATRIEDGWNLESLADSYEAPSLQLAYIDLDETVGITGDPEEDFAVEFADPGKLLLGETAIQASRFFDPDLKNILSLTGTEL